MSSEKDFTMLESSSLESSVEDPRPASVQEVDPQTPMDMARSEIFSLAGTELRQPLRQRKFKSARLVGEYEKPWTAKKDPRMVWDKVFFWGLAAVGACIGAYIIYSGWASVDNPDYCLIFEDDFQNGISSDDWNHEVQLNGFGSGAFDWTTTDEKNAYTDAEGLHIVPTFTTETTDITSAELLDNYVLNLTSAGDDSCTSTSAHPGAACSTKSNKTTGVIINPVRSARLNTKGKHSITYGKIEVVAKLPRGNWLWPAIWMMPVEDRYGAWPASGEIDIMESKGNDGDSYAGGRNQVSSTLHWGPTSDLNQYWRTNAARTLQRKDYSDSFHTFGIEWTENYIFTYVNSRLAQTLYVPFGKKYGTMYERGNLADTSVNGSVPADPWASTGRYNTPFDASFYLILNVAVGANNGYFEDGVGGKPWIDDSDVAMRDFWAARTAWNETWGEGAKKGMTVKSVKMWREGKCATSA